MSALSVEVPFPVFYDRAGEPLENGYVWIGQANLNPQTNPIQVYFDKNLTQPAAQPLRTLAGYIANAGTPAQIYVDAVDFSILVQDKNGTMVYNFPNGTGISANACGIDYDPPFVGGVQTTVCAKLEETVSLDDFGGNVAAAISAAVSGNFVVGISQNVTVQIPSDCATLQTAIDRLSPNNQQVSITLNIESGHQPSSGITVYNGDYSQFRITSTDAEVVLSPSFGTSANFVYGLNAKLPRLACLIDANSKANYGYAAWGASVGYVEANCGVKNTWGDGCRAYGGSTIYAFATIWTGCAKNNTTGSGIVSWGSTVFASGADVSNSMYYGAQAAHGGVLVIDNGTANNCFRYNLRATDAGWMSADGVTSNYAGCEPGTNLPYSDPLAAGYGIYAFNGSWIAARDASATNAKHSGVLASNGCTIHARGATLTDCGQNGVFASPCSTVDATQVDVSGAGNYGLYASGASNINATSAIANNCGTSSSEGAVFAEWGSTINFQAGTATGASGNTIRAGESATINANDSTLTGSGNRAAYAYSGSRIGASGVTATGAANEGLRCDSGSNANIQSSNFQRGGSPATTDIIVNNGSFVNASGATGGVSQTVNVLTVEGVIFR